MASRLLQTIPWLGNPPDALHRQAATSIIGLWTHDAGLGDSLVGMAWVIDGMTEDEAEAVSFLLELAQREPGLAALLLDLPWVAAMPIDAPRDIEWGVFNLLYTIGLDKPELGTLLASHPLIAADVTYVESNVMELLAEAGYSDLERAKRLAAVDWVADGIEPHELRLLFAIVSLADSPMSPSEFLLRIPSLTDHLTGDLRLHATRALTGLALHNREYLEQVIAQPWFADGLEDEEAVLVVILERAAGDSPALFRDLLTAHFSQTREVELPLTEDVRLWVVQNSPFADGDDLLREMEDTVRHLEELTQEPFPTDYLILSVVDPSEGSYGSTVGGEWLNTHMRLIRDPLTGIVEEIPHEAGHFIFKGPRWYSEGASELGEAYVNHRRGAQTLEQRREQLAMDTTCARYANIRHWTHQTDELGVTVGDVCPYILGENFLLNTWELLGQENTSAALRELHVLHRDGKQSVTEELIFDVLSRNTPVGKEDEFLDLYRRLHGGSFALQDTNFDDGHADDATNASIANPGQSISGELDYLFDFDYFRFQAQEGQKYRIAVQHPSLPAHWVTLYAPDGVTQEIGRWRSRIATPFGPELLWTAAASGGTTSSSATSAASLALTP